MGVQPMRLAVAALLLMCISAAATRGNTGLQMEPEQDDFAARMRSLLDTELTVANDNKTYPNATVNVGISHPDGCVPWWKERIAAGDTVCPKDCELSGFKDGYNLGQLAPLNIKLEKGATSRVAPRPLKGAYLNVTGTTRLPNRKDFVAQTSNNFGLEFVQFTGNYDVGAKFTAFIGLVKKDPNQDGAAVPDPKAKHTPYCYFNVTWLIVPVGSTPAAAPLAAPPAAAKKPAAPAPSTVDPFDL